MRFTGTLRSAAVLGLIAATALVVGCGGGAEEESDDKAGTSSGSATAETIVVSMKDNVFEPKEITVAKGAAITFEAKNVGQVVHDMHIMSQATEGKDFMSNITVNPGESSKFTATFTKAGTVKFQCDYHLPDMVGTITVK